MKKVTIIFLMVLAIFAVVFLKSGQEAAVERLRIEIADTPEERVRGLSDWESLDDDAGLLFVHDEPGIYGIWMKDMKFPIDVIWLDEDHRVVDMAEKVEPDSFPQVFEPSAPALYILEVNAGFAERNGIEVGQVVGLFIDGE